MLRLKRPMTIDDPRSPAKRKRGVYTLILKVGEELILQIGSLALVRFRPALYLYTGSALGSGGLDARLSRHLRREKQVCWHIDHLTGDPRVTVVGFVSAESREKMECRVNRLLRSRLEASPFPGFGSSDCRGRCLGHLLYVDMLDRQRCIEKIRRVYVEAGLNPVATVV